VKSPKGPFFVIPAYEPESSIFKDLQKIWTPFFNGVTTFYESIKIRNSHKQSIVTEL